MGTSWHGSCLHRRGARRQRQLKSRSPRSVHGGEAFLPWHLLTLAGGMPFWGESSVHGERGRWRQPCRGHCGGSTDGCGAGELPGGAVGFSFIPARRDGGVRGGGRQPRPRGRRVCCTRHTRGRRRLLLHLSGPPVCGGTLPALASLPRCPSVCLSGWRCQKPLG